MADVDKKVVGKAFRVEVDGVFLPIKSYSGGDITGEKAEASSGGSQHNESTLGNATTVSLDRLTDSTLSDAEINLAKGRGNVKGGYGETVLGHNVIKPIRVRAYVTPDSKVLTDAADLICNKGQNHRFTITIYELAKDMSIIKTHTYGNCIFVSLDYPRVDADGGEILVETAVFQPETLEVA